MTCKIVGNDVWLTRGDSFVTDVGADYVDEEGKPTGDKYVPEVGDTCRFALKSAKMTIGQQNFVDEEPLIYKNIPVETMILTLEPTDTKELPFGRYKYDIELVHVGGVVDTIIADADFTITPEVD